MERRGARDDLDVLLRRPQLDGHVVGRQRTRDVERERSERMARLQRLVDDELFQLWDDLGVSSEREVSVEPALHGRPPDLGQLSAFGFREGRFFPVGVRPTSPQSHRTCDLVPLLGHADAGTRVAALRAVNAIGESSGWGATSAASATTTTSAGRESSASKLKRNRGRLSKPGSVGH